MSYEKKTPSIRAKLSIDDYNKLIELLSDRENLVPEEVRKNGDEIKNKLLMFSEIIDDKVLVGFFPSQIEYVLYVLLTNITRIGVSENFYRILVENKEKYKKNKEMREENNYNE